MIRLTLLFLFFLCLETVSSQRNVGVNIDSDLSAANIRVYSVASFDTRDNTYKGSPLLWENWMYGSIWLNGNTSYSSKQYNINYDVLSRQFFVKIGRNIYALATEKVNKMLIVTSIEEPTAYRVISNERGSSDFFEVLYEDDELELLALTNAKVGKAYYNTALDAGDIKPSIVKSKSLYIYKSDRLFELPRKRKQFIQKYEKVEEIKDVVDFFKKKRIALKDEQEVQSALIEFNKTK